MTITNMYVVFLSTGTIIAIFPEQFQAEYYIQNSAFPTSYLIERKQITIG